MRRSDRSGALLGLAALLALLGTAPHAQETTGTTEAGSGDAAADLEEQEDVTVSAEALRGRIHGMRMNLLLGGDRVRQAETEAIDFYDGKIELVEQRLDSLAAELSEKQAAYKIALTRALEATSTDQRAAAVQEASMLKAELAGLLGEKAELEGKRGGLSKMVGAIESRERERERLTAKIETNNALVSDFALPFTGVGLAPVVDVESSSTPLDDPGLVEDLLALDPAGGRQLLFEMDPGGYWERFPLQPPTNQLQQAFGFPLPDLPEYR
jgi:hypothetical protein